MAEPFRKNHVLCAGGRLVTAKMVPSEFALMSQNHFTGVKVISVTGWVPSKGLWYENLYTKMYKEVLLEDKEGKETKQGCVIKQSLWRAALF